MLVIGLFQFLLIPAMLWNFLFPIILLFTFGLFLFQWRKHTSRSYKICMVLLAFLLSLELGCQLFLEEDLINPENPIELKVMTYNVFFKNGHPNSTIEVIKKADPDVLLIQELTPKWSMKINEKLSKTYPFKFEQALTGAHGIGIYSKYKIKKTQKLNNNYNKPIAQIVELKVQNKTIQLANVHLASPAIAVENKDRFFSLYHQNYKQRKSQMAKVNNALLTNSNKYDCQFLAGDLNTLVYEPIFKNLKSDWVDSYDEKGALFKYNFPNSSKIKPILILDYILLRGKAKCIESKIIDGGNSDHLALMSTMKI